MRRHFRRMHDRFSSFWWDDRGLVMILVLLLLGLAVQPVLDSLAGRILSSIFLSLLLLTGITRISPRRLPRIWAGLVALTAVVFIWLNEVHPGSPRLDAASSFSALCFLALLTYVIIGRAFQEGPVTGSRILGAIAGYLLIGMTWATIYRLLNLALPGAIRIPPPPPGQPAGTPESQLTYFSFVTLTTLGYGDIVPVHPAARIFAFMEALVGQIFPATLLARLVALETTERSRNKP